MKRKQRGRSILEIAGPVSILQPFTSLGRDLSPCTTEQCLLVPRISPRHCEHCSELFCSVSLSVAAFSHFLNLWPLPFLRIFPPLPPHSCLPSVLLEHFLPEVCQTLNHLFVRPCSGRNSQQGGGTTKAFCLYYYFFFIEPFSSLQPPHNKISSCAQKANLATLTTIITLFSNLSFYMSFKSLNILNKFFHSIQVGASCYMHLAFWLLNIFIVFSGNAELPTPQYSHLPWISSSFNWETLLLTINTLSHQSKILLHKNIITSINTLLLTINTLSFVQ